MRTMRPSFVAQDIKQLLRGGHESPLHYRDVRIATLDHADNGAIGDPVVANAHSEDLQVNLTIIARRVPLRGLVHLRELSPLPVKVEHISPLT